ncbi:30S ribosome-binding factor RbfA [Thermodesulfovibrionales bacterium]|nr:30S ribosome-binding factor RbfA [Thermodesulfovibrionales bacterium]MCL0086652.1 30S ribosome-binding factor RbfA [Thermodesulfovibrionales bacterium]
MGVVPPNILIIGDDVMHPYKRSKRLGALLREEIADIIITKVQDTRLGFVTVTDVDLSKDLKNARVFISILDDRDRDRDVTIEILNSARGFIRNEVSKRVRVKFIPTIEFRIDRSIDHGGRIEKLLSEIREGHVTTDRVTPTT